MVKIVNVFLYKNGEIDREYKDIKCMYKDDTYIFYIDKTKTILNKDAFVRENDEFLFKLDIVNKNASYLLKGLNNSFMIDVEYVFYKNDDLFVKLDYRINSDDSDKSILLEIK